MKLYYIGGRILTIRHSFLQLKLASKVLLLLLLLLLGWKEK